MKRPLVVWLVFAACAVIGLAVLGWFSHEMLRLERGAEQAREIAAREENVRLALWRMDSALASVHGLEAARPPADYAPFQRSLATFSADLSPIASDGVMLPSPLLGFTPPFVRLHLQIEGDGRISSPQVPEGTAYLAALRAGTSMDSIGAASTRLQQLRASVPAAAFTSAFETPALVAAKDERSSSSRLAFDGEIRPDAAQEVAQATPPAPQAERQAFEELKKNRAEQQQRADLVDDNTYNYTRNAAPQQRARAAELRRGGSGEAATTPDPVVLDADLREPLKVSEAGKFAVAPEGLASAPAPAAAVDSAAPPMAKGEVSIEEAAAGPLQTMWLGNDLFFVRRIEGDGHALAQAVWLDWPELRAWLLSRVTDLLPDAVLEPVPADSGFTIDDSSRRLAFLPVRLRPGVVPLAVSSMQSPLQISLAIAWVLAGVGVVALALLLAGTLRLSERRGAFVSAVTHELRTPLTTFRMYTEMLASGMVPDEAKRRSYLDTLRKEAERLSHLVENVLSYARLERGRASQRIEDTTPGALLARIEERLRQRAEQGGLALSVAFDGDAAELPLRTDTTAFEQIIFNLVDNAAKYARRPEGGGTLAIQVAAGARGKLVVRVSDNGPGIAASVRKRLFQPFSKSAAEAAHSQPGVGLGLALSRRLARDELHGELALERTGPEGTVFRLEV